MKIYIGKNKAEAKQISFINLFERKLREANIQMDNVDWSHENYVVIGIIKDDTETNKKNPKQLTINFGFNFQEDKIEEIKVWSAPIVTIVDEDNSVRLV